MLKNYFKLAIAVLKRRKFFTFISLFGIGFTLTILIVLMSFIDKVVNDTYPDQHRSRSLYVTKLKQYLKDGSQSTSGFSFYFLDHYLKEMKTPADISISSVNRMINTYVNNKKVLLNIKYTNSSFWNVLDFKFLEGSGYTNQQIKNGEPVVILSANTRKEYFGSVTSVVGMYLEADNVKYRIAGVVKDVSPNMDLFYSDIYLPYTFATTDYRSQTYQGDYNAILLAPSKNQVPAMRAEYDAIINRISQGNTEGVRLYSRAESYANSLVSTGNENDPGASRALTGIIVFALLFMLLPAINLININLTRIMERASEIGVRKAFGASSRTLIYQFIVENIILTLIGGLIALVGSSCIIIVINKTHLIQNIELSINFVVLFYSLLICLLFGLISGVYPAWRMSRMNVVGALKIQ